MSFIMTLVGARRSPTNAMMAAVMDQLVRANCGPQTMPGDPGSPAVDLSLAAQPDRDMIYQLRDLLAEEAVDLFVQPAAHRRKKLLLADMDATIVTSETLDELAAYAGLQEKIAAMTARAMAGEIDFRDALRERVLLLKGLPEAALRETLEKTELTLGAAAFVGTMARHGALCVLVSGGFTFFTGAIAARAGFHHHHGNVLGIEEDRLNGLVGDPILDKGAKLRFLQDYAGKSGLLPEETLAIGDGANDLPMLEAAGLGIGYHPKKLVEDALDNCILHGDLTAVLYAQGYKRADFAEPTAR